MAEQGFNLGDVLGTLGDYARATLKHVFMPGTVGMENRLKYEQALLNAKGQQAQALQNQFFQHLAQQQGMDGNVTPNAMPNAIPPVPQAAPRPMPTVVQVNQPRTLLEDLITPGGTASSGPPMTEPGPWRPGMVTPQQAQRNADALQLAQAEMAFSPPQGDATAPLAAPATSMPAAAPTAPRRRNGLAPGQSVSLDIPGGGTFRMTGPTEDASREDAFATAYTSTLQRLMQADPTRDAQEAAKLALVEVWKTNPALIPARYNNDIEVLTGISKQRQTEGAAARRQEMMESPTTPGQRALAAANAKNLKPGTDEFNTFVRDFEAKDTANKAAAAQAQLPISSAGQTKIAQGNQLLSALDNLLALAEQPSVKNIQGPAAGRFAKMANLVGIAGSPEAANFLTASGLLEDTYRHNITGAQAGFRELSYILSRLPGANMTPEVFNARVQEVAKAVVQAIRAQEQAGGEIGRRTPDVHIPPRIAKLVGEQPTDAAAKADPILDAIRSLP